MRILARGAFADCHSGTGAGCHRYRATLPDFDTGRIGHTFNRDDLADASNRQRHRNFAAPARIDLEAQALHEVVGEHPVLGAGEAGLGERLTGSNEFVSADRSCALSGPVRGDQPVLHC